MPTATETATGEAGGISILRSVPGTLRTLGAAFDAASGTAVISEEVAGTQYEGRSQRIESVRVGDAVKLVREPDNAENSQNISVRNSRGESLGNLPSWLCTALADLMDAEVFQDITASVSEVVPLSKRSSRARKAILKLDITFYLRNLVNSMVCKLAGDQVKVWVQELTVSHSMMPLEHAKLLFELYNRSMEEYDNLDKGLNDTSYAGLDNLEEEIRAAREKMQKERIPGLDYSKGKTEQDESFGEFVQRMIRQEPDRYGVLKDYDVQSYSSLEEILESRCIGEEHYFWLDQTRVSQEEYGELDGFSHWYEILELYGKNGPPVDLRDEDVVSIFGCGKFEAFADLSYGC